MSDRSDNTAGRSAPERTVVTPPSMKSKYWRHFGFWTIGGQIENKKNVVCKLCKRELPYNSNTTNMRSHLEKHHPLECSEIHVNTPTLPQSPTDKCLLEDKQKLLGLKNDNLINDCVTRWNSTYNMICRASEQQAAVAAVIFEKKLSHLELTTNEWMVVENIREISVKNDNQHSCF
ncbi:UNVERIFIED_CONTAM: hypothetical protein FKN15_024907 [Acipenser sinensis]